jgi:hypothetical protein
MKKFLFQCILFVIPFCIIPYGADVIISNTLKKSFSFADGEYSTWNDIFDGKINSDVVIYGSSRAWRHVNPMMINHNWHTTTYNLGINGHPFVMQYFRHISLLKFNKKPKLIIQTLDSETFWKRPDLYNPDQVLPYMLHNEAMKQVILKFNGYTSIDFEVPLLRYYGKKEAFLQTIKILVSPSSNKLVRTYGYQGMDIQYSDELKKLKQKSQFFIAKTDSSVESLFDKFINETIENNIKIVLVYTPEYIEGQEFIKNRSDIIDKYERISQKFNIPFFNYSLDTMTLHRKYFTNSTHMNKFGSEIFTQKLINDLRPLWEAISPNQNK